MTKPRDPDALLTAFLADGMTVLPDRVVDAVLGEVHRTRQQRRAWWPAWRTRSMTRTTFAAAAVAAVVALGGAFFVIQRGLPAVGGPGPTASASASHSQPAVVGPSATPTATPSPTPTPLLWTQMSLDEDWPAPVRPEPDGGAIVLPFVDTYTALSDEQADYPDPSGDTGLPVLPWVDIRELWVGLGGQVTIGLANNVPPAVDPTDQWIAYGVVIDSDRDGVPDWRYGMDNMPVDATGERPHRAWITDLHTGRTESNAGGPYGVVGKSFFDTFYPGEDGRSTAHLNFGGGDIAGGGTRPGQVHPFYAWASVIQDGRVVATDYAPDVGWLDPGSTPQVESSPEVDSSPGPTPRVENDPDVPGGRLWTVTVVNKSPRPATLVVAEETENGSMGRVVVGTVTPSVVPPGATVDVTFLLPPDGGEGWWIYVNPGPNDGGLLAWTDVPLWGEIHITADGNMGWLGCPCRP